MKLSCLYVILLLSSMIFPFSHGLDSDDHDKAHGLDSDDHDKAEPYIVYMGDHSLPSAEAVFASNHEFLASYVGSFHLAKEKITHHYHKTFRGFAAMLTPEQVKEIRKNKQVISIFKSKTYKLQTTRSWDFMAQQETWGFVKGLFEKFRVDKRTEDVIVGHIDSGIWPESKSFNPDGLGPTPKHWMGECVEGQLFDKTNCNRKIVGARFYYKGYQASFGQIEPGKSILSARDDYGHGSHTASIAIGSEVKNITMADRMNLTMKGGASNARIAVYKACWSNKCISQDVLNAFDDAVNDNVDLITVSLGARGVNDGSFFEDPISIGSFHAFKKGILVVAAAGNNGGYGTVVNTAPWILTVAASTIDREFHNMVITGDNDAIMGFGVNYYSTNGFNRLLFANQAALPGVSPQLASFCRRNTLRNELVWGSIVVCMTEGGDDVKSQKSEVVRDAGGVGMILVDDISPNAVISFAIPTSIMTSQDAVRLQAYVQSTMYPVVRISPTITEINHRPAPMMAQFSSKGPNPMTPFINKPDVTAPGYNILAAVPPLWNSDFTRPDVVSIGFDSGTSMACPHVSGVAAVIKGAHKNWSPAMIKSALMTTAYIVDNNNQPIQAGNRQGTALDYGSGHISPDRALSPGLVYDYGVEDAVDFLCAISQANRFPNKFGPVFCKTPPVPPYNLNYPSIALGNIRNMPNSGVSVFRTLTFVAEEDDPTVYKAEIVSPPGVDVCVVPDTLDFSNGNTVQSFRLDIRPLGQVISYAEGVIVWTDGYRHQVRTPIALTA